MEAHGSDAIRNPQRLRLIDDECLDFLDIGDLHELCLEEVKKAEAIILRKRKLDNKVIASCYDSCAEDSAETAELISLLLQIKRLQLHSHHHHLKTGNLLRIDESHNPEDSLILPAFDYFTTSGDSARLLTSYLLKAAYLHAKGHHDRELAVLDSGCVQALSWDDRIRAGDFLVEKGECYVYTYKDYTRAADAYRRALT